jgi:5-methyltetrahydrofolate--homocysteine methyltransferase
MAPENPETQSLRNAIIQGDAPGALSLTLEALARNADPVSLLNQGMVPAMEEVGRRFECSEYFIPELLLSARAMKAAMEPVRPLLAQSGGKPLGRVAVGTVKGDLHDIGKNIVASMLEGGGFEVTDLGVNVPPERFIEAARESPIQIIALSALLTTTMMGMKTTIDALRAAGLREQVKVLVGGAPITQKFADEIGADGYGATAVEAVALAKHVLAGTRPA